MAAELDRNRWIGGLDPREERLEKGERGPAGRSPESTPLSLSLSASSSSDRVRCYRRRGSGGGCHPSKRSAILSSPTGETRDSQCAAIVIEQPAARDNELALLHSPPSLPPLSRDTPFPSDQPFSATVSKHLSLSDRSRERQPPSNRPRISPLRSRRHSIFYLH